MGRSSIDNIFVCEIQRNQAIESMDEEINKNVKIISGHIEKDRHLVIFDETITTLGIWE